VRRHIPMALPLDKLETTYGPHAAVVVERGLAEVG
jgi:hypothetical protein